MFSSSSLDIVLCIILDVGERSDRLVSVRCFSRSYSSDTFILERGSPGHSVSQAGMRRAGSAAGVFDLHSHIPAGVLMAAAVLVVLCCSQPVVRSSAVTQRQEAPGERYPCKVRRRVMCLFKGRLIIVGATV